MQQYLLLHCNHFNHFGIGYLFFPEVENNIYKNEFFGDSDVKTHQTLNDAVHQVEQQYEGFFVSKVQHT